MSGNAPKLRALEAQDEQRRLSKEELLRPRKVKDEVSIPQLGGTVEIQSLSHRQRRELQQKAGFGTDDFDEDKLTFLGIVESVVDPKLTVEDVAALAEQDYAIIDALSTYITHLNLFGAAGDLGKGSRPSQNSDSASSSQNDSE